MLIIIYDSSLPSPHTVVSPQSNTMLPAKKVQHSQFLQCSCIKFQGSIREQQEYNNSQMQFIHLQTHIGVEFTQYVCRTHSTIVFLVCNLFYPLSHISLFFLISPFNTVIYIPFLYKTRSLGFTYLLFLCLFLPASIPFPDREHCYILQHGPGQVGVFLLLIFAVIFKLSLAVLRYGLLYIPSGQGFCLKFFSELVLILGGSTHLCFKLLFGTEVPLQSPLVSADGDQFGVATVLDQVQYWLLVLLLASLYLQQHQL